MLTPKEEETIKELKAGGNAKEVAATKLYKNFKESFIRKATYKYSLNNDELNEAYDDTIVDITEYICKDKYEPQSGKTLEHLVARFFRNKCVDIIRKKIRQKEEENLSNLLPPTVIIPNDDEEHWIVIMELCYKKISEPCKKIIERSKDGYTFKEIAEEMSYKSADVAKQKVYNCRKQLWNYFKLFKNG